MTSVYRPDIDGLRAIAVSTVIAYHVGIPGFGGGFVGVDIFFVISGFLITKLLLEELQQRGSIDLLAFYARRARRLLPAFFLVVTVTLILGAFLLLPVGDEQQSLATSARAAALYVSNVHFARRTGGYFDHAAELMPLLHTWSLAVEEQFYLVWPMLLIACAWIACRRKWPATSVIAVILVVICIGSLTYGQIASQVGGRIARFAFFGLPSRAWELGVGAGLALALPYLRPSAAWAGAALAAPGLLAIVFAVAWFEEGMPYPGTAALLPVVGAAAIVAAGHLAPHSALPRLLSTSLFTGIGLVSYGWYLWHWPLLAIARTVELGRPDIRRDCAIACIALGFAWMTYVWLERPIRRGTVWGQWGKRRVLATSAAASLALIAGAYGLGANAKQLSQSERYQRYVSASLDKTWSGKYCHHKNGRCPQAPQVSYRGSVIVWGDSHADHFAPMIEAAVAPLGFALVSREMGGCPPVTQAVILADARPFEECARFNAAVLAEIERAAASGDLAGVILSARWPLYLGQPKATGEPSPRLLALPGQPPSVEAAAAAVDHGVRAIVVALVERDIRVVVIAPGPEHRYDIPLCLARKSLAKCSIGRGEAEIHRAAALSAITSGVHEGPSVRIWDPFSALCDDSHCPPERDGLVLYHDDGHLTHSGSRSIAPHFAGTAAWLVGGRL